MTITYYIEKNNQILLFDTDKTRLENTLSIQPQYKSLPILETGRPIVDFEFADTEEYLAEQFAAAKEAKYKEANESARAYLESGEALYGFSIPSAMGEGQGGGLPVGVASQEDETSGVEVEESEPYGTSPHPNPLPTGEGESSGADSPQGEGETGGVYHIEATDGNIGKLTAYALGFITGQLGADDVVYWNTKEDVTITLTQTQLSEVLAGLGQVQAQVWNVKFPAYLAQIEACQTADEVRAIVVDYSLS